MKSCLIGKLLSVAVIVPAMAGAAAGQSLASSSNNASLGVPRGTALVAELAKSIDAKKAKTGDAVKATIAQDLLANGHIVVHRGSKLMGHVTVASAYGQNDPKSVLGVVFDRLALKGGEEVTFNAVLVALAPPAEQFDVLSSESSNYGGGPPSSLQHVSHGDAQAVVDPRDEIDHTRADALKNAADPSYYGSNNRLHNGILGAGNRGVFRMPGISLKAAPGTGTQLVSTNDDIKLERGTQMVLGVTAGR